jgi:Flp pilus assembly CpaF family ATPase
VRTALDVVAGEVRELIRRRGLDPFIDPAPVRVLVRDVVADYSERSLNSALPRIGDPESVVRDVLERVAGFGPLQRYLDDPEIEEIWVNEPGRVFVAKRGRSRVDSTVVIFARVSLILVAIAAGSLGDGRGGDSRSARTARHRCSIPGRFSPNCAARIHGGRRPASPAFTVRRCP